MSRHRKLLNEWYTPREFLWASKLNVCSCTRGKTKRGGPGEINSRSQSCCGPAFVPLSPEARFLHYQDEEGFHRSSVKSVTSRTEGGAYSHDYF
jgi:hypothetical protein